MRVEFRHQVVRDLAWVISSPSLLRGESDDRVSDSWCRLAFHDRIPWLRELDRAPQPLHAWLAARRSRLLGVYFEALVEFWLAHWHRMQLHAARLPLRGRERAIGEFDFLFRDRYLGIDYHWETAVKYFLRYRREGGREEWLGPNPRDTWQKKHDKVFDHQLRLSEQAEAHTLLQGLGIGALRPAAFIKGYLFEPLGHRPSPQAPLPLELSPHHLTGWWCRSGECERIPQRSAGSRWLSLPRLKWLSAVYSREGAPGVEREACIEMLAAHFDGSQKPILLAELERDGDGIWRECRRGFVVADHWPALRPRQGDTMAPHESSQSV